MDDWQTIQQDAYPAYIGWEEFMANQARLTDNASRYTERTRGAVRAGKALLVGLVVCGRCGRQMQVEYTTHHHYVCSALGKEYGAPLCLYLDGASLEAVVVDAFFHALQPAELDLLDAVLAAQQADHARLAQQCAEPVTRAEYEARLAQRQYQAVDPDNRLVAAELERRWEVALRALAAAREAVDQVAQAPRTPTLDPVLRVQLRDLSTHLPTLWTSGRLTPAQKKAVLRRLIRRVVLTRPQPDTVEAMVVWVSGAMTPLAVHPPVHCSTDIAAYDELVARVGELSAAGYHDRVIAEQLTAEGFGSARHSHVPATLVTHIRRKQAYASLTSQFRGQEQIAGQWTVWGLSRALQVDRNWLYVRIHAGLIPATRHPVIGHYLIPDDPALLERLRAQRPSRRQR